MKRLIILFIALTISASFDQIQGDFFYYQFSFSKVKMILPEYLSIIVKYVAAIAIIWVSYFQETEYRKEFFIAAWLMTGYGFDFLLECNQGWFDIGPYAFGYRSIAFIIFGLVVIKVVWNTIKSKWTLV